MADEQTPPLQPKSFLNIHQPVLSTHLYQVHQPTDAHRQVHWQQQQQLWSQQLHQQQHPIAASHQNVQEIWQDTSPRFSQVWHPAHQQATSTIPIASHHQLITTPGQAITVDQSHTRNQFFEQHQENHGQLHVGIPGQGDLNRDQHPQLTRDHSQTIGRTSPNMQFYQPQQTNHHQRLEYWQQQQQQFQEQPQHSPNPEQRLHSPALQTSKAPETSTPSSHLMWQSPQVAEQRQQSPVAHHQTSTAQVNVDHRLPSQDVPSSVPSTQPVLVPHPGWQQLTPTNIPQLQMLQQQMQQGQGQQQNQQDLMQQQLMFIQLQQMYHQQVLAAQLAAAQMQQQQQQSHATPERTEDKPSHLQASEKQTSQHQPLFGQFNKPSVSLSDIKSETHTSLPERSIQRNVESNQFALNNPPQHGSDPFKQHRTVADGVPKAHVLPMKPEPKVTDVSSAQPVADLTAKLKAETVAPVVSTPEKVQQPSPKQQQVQQDPLKPYESVFLKREQQFQANQAQRQRAAQLPYSRPQTAPGAVSNAPYQRPQDRSNFPTQQNQAQQGAWKATFNRPMNQPLPSAVQKPGLPLRQDYKPPSWQSGKKFPDTPNVPISQQKQQNASSGTGPTPLPQRAPRQSKQVPTKDNKENKENQPSWYNPYSEPGKAGQKIGAEKASIPGKSKTPVTALKAEDKGMDSKTASDGLDASGVRALKGRLPGSYPGEHPAPSAPSASLVFGKPQGKVFKKG